jgi:hypothetical protein
LETVLSFEKVRHTSSADILGEVACAIPGFALKIPTFLFNTSPGYCGGVEASLPAPSRWRRGWRSCPSKAWGWRSGFTA